MPGVVRGYILHPRAGTRVRLFVWSHPGRAQHLPRRQVHLLQHVRDAQQLRQRQRARERGLVQEDELLDGGEAHREGARGGALAALRRHRA